MSPAPLVSIVMPVFNDESTVAAALESALRQSLCDVEIVCVDDASTDGTAEVIEAVAARDPRVRLIRHEHNLSAFQARRTGCLAVRAEYVLFLDGDDELTVDAARRAHETALATDADLVGFGVTVVDRRARTGGSYEDRLQPVHRRLAGTDVLAGLFPVGEQAQGQLWRYLFCASLLRDAYALLPDDLTLARVNDLPLMFFVAAIATQYVSISDQLYRYHFGRGGSGHDVDSIERAEFYTSAIRSIDSVRPAVCELARTHPAAALLSESFESVRLSIVGYVCSQLIDRSDNKAVLNAALAHLHTVASGYDIIHAAARFYPRVLTTLRFHTPWLGVGDRPVRSIVLATSTVQNGGVSAVIASQAHYLQNAGYDVTVVARRAGSDARAIPTGAAFVELTARSVAAQLEEWAAICRDRAVDLVIDHQVLYTRYWPEFALVARAEGASTIGWIHNFVARPVYDGDDRLSLIEECSNTLARLIVLSPLDVAYFKLRGVTHTSYLPNPPSPVLLEAAVHAATKSPPNGRLELIWWGRLEQHTKRVLELIEVGVQLHRLDVKFRLRVIGPDWNELTAKKFNAEARRRGVGDRVIAIGPRHGRDLVSAIDTADAFVSTSIIEGYQLTIAEAQARGLPVFMYELPWLTLVQNNAGIVAVPQGDARALAREIARVAEDIDRYCSLSASSIAAAHRARSHDFTTLYQGVVTNTLSPAFSPEATLEDAAELLRLMVFFAERSNGRGAVSRGGSSRKARVWDAAAPLGRAMLQRFPSLRPLAHNAKKRLLGR